MKTCWVVLILSLAAVPAQAQRLPATVTPVHYDLASSRTWPRRPSPATRRSTSRSRRRQTAIVLNAAEITFEKVAVTAGGRTQAADGDARCHEGSGDVHRADVDSGRRRQHPDHLHRHPERRPARAVSEQGEQPPLRGHAARSDRRAAHVPVVRRAGVQGDVRAHRGDRQRRPRDLERRRRLRHARPGAGKHTVDVRDDAEDVLVPRGAGGRRLRVQRRRRPTAFRSASARRRTRRR